MLADTPHSTTARANLSASADMLFHGMWASIFYGSRKAGKSMVICSADRREGASTIACGLALAGSMPSGVSRVALLDFNLRNPALHDLLGLREGPGVSEIILDKLAPEAAVQRVNSCLDVYTVGQAHGGLLTMLRGQSVSAFLNAIGQGYDHVLIDAAPANQFPDAQILASVVGSALLVVRSQQTPREAVAQARKRLESDGGRVVGCVLNLRTYPIPKFLYRLV